MIKEENMKRGYIKLYRKFEDWEWYTDVNTKVTFLHLLLIANHKDCRYRSKMIRKGQLITTIKQLSFETGLSVEQVRRSLRKLEMTGEISRKSSNQNTLFTINNWEKYQCNKDM